MKTPDDHLLARWLDGALSAEDTARFEAMMANDPSLREEAESMRRMGEAIRATVTFERAVPHGDFFNSQIQERIGEMQRTEDRERVAASTGASWLSWLKGPWILAGAAAALAVGFFVFRGEPLQTQIVSLYTPNMEVHANAFHSDEADATVLMLDGLQNIPAEKDLAGINVQSSETDTEYATTTLYDGQGQVLLVMGKDARNQPILLSGNP